MPDPATQRWQADSYQRHTGFVPVLGAAVLELLAPCPGERILDLGCGDGALTEKLVAAGADVVGVDASDSMIAAARARGLDARLGCGQKLEFDGAFDAVFSNAALHWMLDPDAVIAGVHRALRPGGRFVGEFGSHGNVAAITVALLAVLDRRGIDGAAANPWYFPTAEAYRRRLEAGGFEVGSIAPVPRPTPLPTDMEGWLRYHGRRVLRSPRRRRPAGGARRGAAAARALSARRAGPLDRGLCPPSILGEANVLSEMFR